MTSLPIGEDFDVLKNRQLRLLARLIKVSPIVKTVFGRK